MSFFLSGKLIAEMADTVATCLLDVTDLSSGLKFEGRAANDPFTQLILTEPLAYRGPFRHLENSLHNAVAASDKPNILELLQYMDVFAQLNDCKPEITRILWRVIIESPDPLADFIFSSLQSPFNFDFIDDINGRTCLHEATIVGNVRLVDVCLEKSTQIKNSDIYGRSALHYASMNGHADICSRLLGAGLSALALDLDNSTPIVYATLQGSVDCVKVLLDKESVIAQTETSLIPLSLASRSGHVGVVTLLLQRGALCLPNTNGEYPMHLAAREGHAEVCQLLLHRDGWDVPDKYHEWTPLFHAARHGRFSCIKVLLQAGCRTCVVDEFGHKAVHYAAWHGHHECVSLLLDAGDTGSTPVNPPRRHQPFSPNITAPSTIEGGDIDLIPLLDLPPPIIPYRAYGHSYLNKAYLVQVAIGTSASRFNPLSRDRNLEVQFHPRLISSSSKDEYLLTSNTLKLVMTTSPDVTSAPYSISLPQPDDEGLFSFQISSLDALSLHFSLYPNFGTKTIGRAVAQPPLFSSVNDSASFVLPILDHRLHVIGQVSDSISSDFSTVNPARSRSLLR
jgi:CDK inhibitor PHO81